VDNLAPAGWAFKIVSNNKIGRLCLLENYVEKFHLETNTVYFYVSVWQCSNRVTFFFSISTLHVWTSLSVIFFFSISTLHVWTSLYIAATQNTQFLLWSDKSTFICCPLAPTWRMRDTQSPQPSCQPTSPSDTSTRSYRQCTGSKTFQTRDHINFDAIKS
jgi:hypothetical protein